MSFTTTMDPRDSISGSYYLGKTPRGLNSGSNANAELEKMIEVKDEEI